MHFVITKRIGNGANRFLRFRETANKMNEMPDYALFKVARHGAYILMKGGCRISFVSGGWRSIFFSSTLTHPRTLALKLVGRGKRMERRRERKREREMCLQCSHLLDTETCRSAETFSLRILLRRLGLFFFLLVEFFRIHRSYIRTLLYTEGKKLFNLIFDKA